MGRTLTPARVHSFVGEEAVKCPSFHDHTPAPSGYNQWHDWARKMLRTHKQIRCTGCGLYQIWIPRRRSSPAPAHKEQAQ